MMNDGFLVNPRALKYQKTRPSLHGIGMLTHSLLSCKKSFSHVTDTIWEDVFVWYASYVDAEIIRGSCCISLKSIVMVSLFLANGLKVER